MCGIVGAVVRTGALATADLERSVGTLSHRGPDGRGVLLAGRTEHWDVWLAHARLAIVDLSPGGAQPMQRASGAGASAITFNGEVYNHRALRTKLEPSERFTSSSDTEVLLAGLLAEGPAFLKQANAMLALGMWDARRGELILARDRLGKKPLYLYQDETRLLFASEIKALVALGAPLDVDEASLAMFRWLGYVPDQRAIWKRFRKLPPATFARLRLEGARLPEIAPELYWDPLASLGRRFDGSFDEAIDETLALLDDATRLRVDADVPVGVFLSGGIDSTLVASSVARVASRRMTAFTIQAADPRHDESAVARASAARLGLDFEPLPLPTDAYDRQIEKLAWHYDEPLADLSQIALMANSEAARKRVTVVLTGDGGDEVFLGYPRVSFPEQVWNIRQRLVRVPGARGVVLAALDTTAGLRALELAVRAAGRNVETLRDKKDILGAALRAREPAEIFDRFQCARQPESLSRHDRALIPASLLALARAEHPNYSWDAAAQRSLPELLGALDLVTYLRGDILVKTDRATMAYSLEARCPLLDYRIVELGMSLPLAYKLEGRTFKRVLRAACERRAGPEVARRPKQGFGLPEPANAGRGASAIERWAQQTESRFFERWSPQPYPRAHGVG